MYKLKMDSTIPAKTIPLFVDSLLTGVNFVKLKLINPNISYIFSYRVYIVIGSSYF